MFSYLARCKYNDMMTVQQILSILSSQKEELKSNELASFVSRYEEPLLESSWSEEDYRFVKAADKLSAWLKCIEERKMGNTDFYDAERTIQNELVKMQLPEADYFCKHFIPAYTETIDRSGNATMNGE